MRTNYSNLIDEWKLITGEDIRINNNIIIKHHTVRDVLELGKDVYYNNIFAFIVSPHNYMVELWDSGILYNEMSNWDLFIKLFCEEIRPDSSIYKRYKDIIGDYDFTLMQKENGEYVFYNKKHDFIIDELIYTKISSYLKYINNIPFDSDINPDKDKKKGLGKLLIGELVKLEKYSRMRRQNSPKKNKSDNLLSYVNRLVWATGKSYNEVLNMKLYQFRMGIEVLNKIKVYEEVKLGYYTGNLDSKQVLMQNYDWLNK